MRGRKSVCPVSVKHWKIEVWSPALLDWVRVRGLREITYTTDADTEDGSSTGDVWEEPYIIKRSGTLSLAGKPIADPSTGFPDAGQELLAEYGEQAGCDADLTIRITDPYGHSAEAVFQVTGTELSAGEDGDEISWDLDMVGEAEAQPYIQAAGISLTVAGSSAESVSMDILDAPRLVEVSVSPENASNRRYSIACRGRVVRIADQTDGSFTIAPLKVGTATLKVTSVNGGHTASVVITVTADAWPFLAGVLGTGILGAMTLGRAASA